MGTCEIVAETDTLTNADPRWHELRRAGLGGSDAPVLAGIPGRRSEYDLWLEKISESPPDVSDQGDNTPRYWGHRLEPVMADEFSQRSGYEVVDVPLLLRSTEHPFMQANLDRMVLGADGTPLGPLEIKTTRFDHEWERVGDILAVPARVQAQVMHYLAVTGYERSFVIVLIGGQRAEIAEIERTDNVIADLIDLEARFWDLVERRVAPATDGSASTRRALQARWKAAEGKVVDLPPVAEFLWAERKRLKAEIKPLAETVDEIENELLAMCGDAEQANLAGEKLFTLKAGKTCRLDTKALEKDQPALVASYRTLPPTRRPYWGRTSTEETQ